MLVPFVLTFVASGFGFAQCRRRLGEGYPRPSPTWQAGWELEESRERRVGSLPEEQGWRQGKVDNEVRERALGKGASPDRVSFLPFPGLGLRKSDPFLILPGKESLWERE